MKRKYRVAVLSAVFVFLSLIAGINNYSVVPERVEANVLSSLHSFRVCNADNDTLLSSIDDMLLRFMRAEALTGGAAVAISRQGRIVYAKGLGFSDVEDSIEMQPHTLMRVASVSKLITAVAVMKLVEQKSIGLHQHVFGPLGVLNNDEYLYFKDKRMAETTVYQLLNHSGGWTARWGDPMFMPLSIALQTGKELPIDMSDILDFMQDKSMHFKPGTASVYSNFGYGVLGEVVAKAARMPYEEFVQSYALAPIGIFDMQIGFSHFEDRLQGEARYYEADTSEVAFDYATAQPIRRRAYGATDIQTLGAAGGWVASATDLLKLVLTIDGFDTVPDQLSPSTIDTMTHHAPGFDPLGWRNTIGNNWFRSGTLAATSAIIGRLDNGVCYVVLLNAANYKGSQLAQNLRNRMNRAIESIEFWPEKDLLAGDSIWQSYIGGYQ